MFFKMLAPHNRTDGPHDLIISGETLWRANDGTARGNTALFGVLACNSPECEGQVIFRQDELIAQAEGQLGDRLSGERQRTRGQQGQQQGAGRSGSRRVERLVGSESDRSRKRRQQAGT